MGNKPGKSDDEFNKMVRLIKSNKVQSSGQMKITINPEQVIFENIIKEILVCYD